MIHWSFPGPLSARGFFGPRDQRQERSTLTTITDDVTSGQKWGRGMWGKPQTRLMTENKVITSMIILEQFVTGVGLFVQEDRLTLPWQLTLSTSHGQPCFPHAR